MIRTALVACSLLFILILSPEWGNADAPQPYDRKLYRHWIDADRDCQNTRQEVLIRESLEPVELDESGCRVVSGLWRCPYTGLTFRRPTMLDIDHYIPLGEVHASGGFNWSKDHRKAYANDLSHPHTLVAVYRGANRSKGMSGPDRWLPPAHEFTCRYVVTWLSLKYYWNLAIDDAERNAIARILSDCFPIQE